MENVTGMRKCYTVAFDTAHPSIDCRNNMAKKKAEVKLKSWGIYTPWDSHSKALPQLLKVTRDVPCELNVEFGYVVNIRKGKNKKLQYCIYHPDIPGDDGKPMAPFAGEEFIKKNDWDFFIGDTIWAPVENKQGAWRITLAVEDEIVADETFKLILGDVSDPAVDNTTGA